ncbi:Rieske 2Fe-2S domain-containing protein [Mycobacterium arosiense]|uniref:Rieske 2Fe-2S domain-containing protein n=1 Tax=Mycobacterium arosiense TaxID=425468 RepID=UPI001301D017|nr:Rieske 2Fe-2S domain-containing protein [Mycobacterium arosiense]
MTITSAAGSSQQTSASRSTEDALAPLVRNSWYVIGFRHEFDRTLKQRWILGEPLCFYESREGELIVLDDRCAHRRFPLSASTLLDDDSIRCKYHGFTFNSEGRCTLMPGGGQPRGVGVRKYPAVHRGPFVWIWTGDNPEDADEDLVAWPELEGGAIVSGYYHNDGNYSLVLENLLDLTHLQFLHGVGGEGFTNAKLELLKPSDFPAQFKDTAVGFYKEWDDVMGMFAGNGGDDPEVPIRRRTEARVLTPGYACGIEFYDPLDAGTETKLRKVIVPHAITPANGHETHQWWAYWQNTPIISGEEAWANTMSTIFLDDEFAVGKIQQYAETDDRSGVREHSCAGDVAALRIRRTLHRLAATERKAKAERS